MKKIKPEDILTLAIFLFVGYFTSMAFLRHDNFHSLRLDLGNMDQTVWNVLNGHGFTLTDPVGTVQESRLAVHADFLLILLAPFYLIWANPKMLLIIQTIMLALGAVPIFWIARKVLHDRWLALLFSITYLLYPTVQLNTLHDFHATSLTTTFFIFAFWYYIEEKPVMFTLFAILGACGKEQFWSVTAIFGIAWILRPRYRMFGSIVTLISVIFFYLLFWKFIPAVTPGKQHWALVYLSEYGGSINDILKNILVHPTHALKMVVAPDRLFYYFQLLFPVGFFSLAAPQILLFAAPPLAINVLTNDQFMRLIDYQYTAGITPWIFVSEIYGFLFASRWIDKQALVAFVIVTTLASVWFWGELPVGSRTRFVYFQTAPFEASAIRRVKLDVPSNATVSVTNNIGAHFSSREFVYNFPVKADSVDYDVVLLGDQYAWPSGDEQKNTVLALLANRNYKLISQEGLFYAFKHR